MRLHPKFSSGVVGIIVAVPLALVFAACNSSSSGSSSTTSAAKTTTASSTTASTTSPTATTSAATSTANFDSCNAVTQADAAGALGQSVSAGVLGNATVEGGLACVFYGPTAASTRTPNTPQIDSVRVVVVEGSNALAWYSNYKETVNAQSVSGYGDQAYWDGSSSLSVMKGNYYVRICAWPADAAPSEADAEKLAATILPNL